MGKAVNKRLKPCRGFGGGNQIMDDDVYRGKPKKKGSFIIQNVMTIAYPYHMVPSAQEKIRFFGAPDKTLCDGHNIIDDK